MTAERRCIVRTGARPSVVAAAVALALGACSSPEQRPEQPRRTDAAADAVVAALCSQIRLADPYLEGIREGTINGERLVDGLGDSAAQLKDAAAKLREEGRLALASEIGRYEHELTRLRIAAQSVEAAEASADATLEHEATDDVRHRAGRVEGLLRRARRKLERAGCPHG
jgi:hypothetical protein